MALFVAFYIRHTGMHNKHPVGINTSNKTKITSLGLQHFKDYPKLCAH